MLDRFFKKEKPFAGFGGFGGGGLGLAGGSGVVVSGGTIEPGGIEPGNGSKYHVFTSPGSLVISGGDITVDFLLVGGGGGGSGSQGGGGGAGRYRALTSQPLTEGTYPVVVGDAGTGGDASGNSTPGGNSVFNGLTSQGGGRGWCNARSICRKY